MSKYNDLSQEQKNLVLMELIINLPHGQCNLGSIASVKKAREEVAHQIDEITQRAEFLTRSARLMGINPANPEEYIAQVVMEERLKFNRDTGETPEARYASH